MKWYGSEVYGDRLSILDMAVVEKSQSCVTNSSEHNHESIDNHSSIHSIEVRFWQIFACAITDYFRRGPDRTRRPVEGIVYRSFIAYSNADRTIIKIEPLTTVYRPNTFSLNGNIVGHSLRSYITTVYSRKRLYSNDSTLRITVRGEWSVNGPDLFDLGYANFESDYFLVDW